MSGHVTSPLWRRFSHHSLLCDQRFNFAAFPPHKLCVFKGKMLWKLRDSWHEQDLISSVSEYLLNNSILCWRRKQFHPVFCVLAASTCIGNLL